MKIQSEISWEQNQKKVGKIYRCVIDRKQGEQFVGRTEIDSPMWRSVDRCKKVLPQAW